MAMKVRDKCWLHASSRARWYVHELVPAFLVTAAVVLVVEHWKHFDAADVALLVLILASLAVNFVTRRSAPSEVQEGDFSQIGKKQRPI